MHTCILAYLHTYILACLHTCILAYLHTCIHAYLLTYILAYLHTYILKNVHTYKLMCVMWELFWYHVGTHAIHMVSMVSWGNFFDTMWEHFWYLWCPWCHVGTIMILCGNISDTYGVMWELLLYLWCPRWSPNKIKISFKHKLKVLLNLLSVKEWYCDLFFNVGTFSKLMVSSRYSAPVVLKRFSLWEIFHY